MQNTAWRQGEPTTLWAPNAAGTCGAAPPAGWERPTRGLGAPRGTQLAAVAHHMSMGVEYSVEPSRTSGGRYHSVTTSLE